MHNSKLPYMMQMWSVSRELSNERDKQMKRKSAGSYIINEMCSDIDKHRPRLLTRRWHTHMKTGHSVPSHLSRQKSKQCNGNTSIRMMSRSFPAGKFSLMSAAEGTLSTIWRYLEYFHFLLLHSCTFTTFQRQIFYFHTTTFMLTLVTSYFSVSK